MKYSAVIIEILRISVLLYCFVKRVIEEERQTKLRIVSIFIVCACAVMKYVCFSKPFIVFPLQLIIMTIYIIVCFPNQKLHYFSVLFIMYVILDLVNLLLAFLTFPVTWLLQIEMYTMKADILLIVFHGIAYLCVIMICNKVQTITISEISVVAKLGQMLLLLVAEFMLLLYRHMDYEEGHIVIYRMMLCGIVSMIAIFGLWICDKMQEQKKIRELISYTHRTREVIPSVGRVLERMDDMFLHMEHTNAIIEELRTICRAEMDVTKREVANIETFSTTGSFSLDGQLERYLEEAANKEFCLDIIVRAPVKEILNEKKIDIYSLLQAVGDLYRNAISAIEKKKKQGRILMCFGYNLEGNYELSIHDNGEVFPEHVLKQLGKRGITTKGTGHGMADIFEVMERNKISFMLKQNLSSNDIFTKSIYLIFDDEANKIIDVR